MSIRPVDLGVIVQRTTEVDRAGQMQNQRAALAQQQFGLELKATLEKRETEVKGAPEAAHLSVNPDAGRESQKRAPGGKKERGSREPETERAPVRRPGDPGGRLDIKL
ncbi:MAG: hypothetical protein ACM3RP_01020 [Chitinophagales bacterium]